MNNNNKQTIVFIGTYPPTDEGIATFNHDLVISMQKLYPEAAEYKVIAINMKDTSPYYFDNRVLMEIDQETPEMYVDAAELVNNDASVKCVIIQHEYGIFGGEWGEYLLQFLKKTEKPVINVLHTVLEEHPYMTEKFKEVTDSIISLSDAVIVLTDHSKEILRKLYPEAVNKTFMIPHGIHPMPFESPMKIKKELGFGGKTVLTTFGLLSRDKGIEYIIKALPAVVEKNPDTLYQFLGQTHPVVRRVEGESYRTELINLVKDLKLRKHVRFVDRYMDLTELLRYLQGTDLYIATSINPDQSVSGTFSFALGAGRAVVSTKFVQSNEVIKDNIGRLVPAKNPEKFSNSINGLLSDKSRLYKMHKTAYRKTRSMLWTNSSYKYMNIIKKIDKGRTVNELPSLNMSHLKKMNSTFGILQFAKHSLPQESFGYTLDDNARALVFISELIKKNSKDRSLYILLHKYLKFVNNSWDKKGYFVNYFDTNLETTKQNILENPIDHYGRALWSLSEILKNDILSVRTRNRARNTWNLAVEHVPDAGNHLRPRAYLIKAFRNAINAKMPGNFRNTIITHANYLCDNYEKVSTSKWHWFEDALTYNNAILPESLGLTYELTGVKKYKRIAKKTAAFLIKKSFMGEVCVPIGQNGWYEKGKKRVFYDQQPEEAAAIVLGFVSLYETLGNKKYLHYANKAFSWFLGNNINGMPLYNYKTGGVYDGLMKESVNKNQGAESLLSYLLARVKIERYIT